MNTNSYYKLLILLLLSSCATFKAQYKDTSSISSIPNTEIEHSFYLIGDAGNTPIGETSKTLEAFKTELSKASKNSTAIFLGDNIYPKGFPNKKDKNRAFAEYQMKTQTDVVSKFKGETIFIPGNHDWYSDGIEGLNRQEKYIEKALGKNTFLPENGCSIENIHISDDIELILIDSQWYMENWDNHPTINDDCDIKTRNDFLDKYESLIKKSRRKTTIVALHHPMYTNGSHGGQYSFANHMKPLPVLGTLKNIIRKTSGIVNVDLQNKRYNEFKRRLVTISQENKKVVFVSGHEHSLQYLIADNLHQIVSGSGSKVSATRNVGAGQFSYGTPGYARLDVFTDGSSHVRFYGTDENKIVYETEVLKSDEKKSNKTYPTSFPKEKAGVIYSKAETDKSGTFKYLWGDRYRKLYSTPVMAPTVDLDTMYGGLKVVRKGGGNQSISLRLEDKNGAQYVMRALRKSAVQYIQALLFKEQYIEGQFDNTGSETFILDVFAGSHPYAPFATGTLSDAIGLYHTNPTLYYIPKQKALGDFNGEFGDALYMIEEHTSEGHSDLASFGFKDKIISTEDVMKKLHKDEDIIIDEASYIRARLFDMLIGDWDRHQDQWRWIEFEENGKKVYRPLPRDRDQAFSIMSDGPLFGLGMALIPAARILRKYDDDLVDVKGVNVEPFPLDMEFIQRSNKAVWDTEVKTIQNGITDAVIDEAFLNFPKEVRDESLDNIKRKLKARRSNLQAISDRYYALVNNVSVIKGTNKDDYFTIECLSNGDVKIIAQRIQKGEKRDVFLERVYNKAETKEIWIYGLDDDDVFEAKGKNAKIKIRLIGGQNNDTYIIPDGGKIVVYDYKSKKNDVSQVKKTRIRLNDDYDVNVYDYKKLKNNTNAIIPILGSNPDDGFKIGVTNINTDYGFERNPFTNKQIISASYYFATEGYDISYSGEFANVFGKLNFGLDAQFNSPNYAINFFGFGNSTPNPEADDDDGFDTDLDYNRVKIRTIKIMPSLVWRGELGAHFKAGIFYESNEVDRTNGRFLDDVLNNNSATAISAINETVFDNQDFFGVDAAYHFENKDDKSFPTLGMQLSLQVGYKNNVATSKGFGYVVPTLGFNYKLIPSGQLVLATHLGGYINLGDDFEFYQAATLGASTGLRGYRNERFTGKSAFVQSTDIRWNIMGLKTEILPIKLGVFGGIDYGRVWIDNNQVFDATFNNDMWNTSIGGGVFVNLAEMMTANISAFNSDDGMRLAFRLGFGF
ncbi:metallophosphoesterase [Lacinutrix jangbogonensis]|uniref:metallophosphoesterase n=1 Tax=Lacinutrix jangbogonensis TaxID=1469557 RepID=UPI00053EA854|nr:metallophosphoesterase [Lacinutrix jangbogonensis]